MARVAEGGTRETARLAGVHTDTVTRYTRVWSLHEWLAYPAVQRK